MKTEIRNVSQLSDLSLIHDSLWRSSHFFRSCRHICPKIHHEPWPATKKRIIHHIPQKRITQNG